MLPLRPPGAMNRAATTVLTLFCLPEWMVEDKGNRYHNRDNSHRAYQEIDILPAQRLAKARANGFSGLLPALLCALLLAINALSSFLLGSGGGIFAIGASSQVLHTTAHLAAVALGLLLSRACCIDFSGLGRLCPGYRSTADTSFVTLTSLPALVGCSLINFHRYLLLARCFHLGCLWGGSPALARFRLVRFCHDCIPPCLRSTHVFLFDERPGYPCSPFFIIRR